MKPTNPHHGEGPTAFSDPRGTVCACLPATHACFGWRDHTGRSGPASVWFCSICPAKGF